MDQAHLCPLTDTTQPVFWEFDHALRLTPLPDVVRRVPAPCRPSTPPRQRRHPHRAGVQVILGDSFPQYEERYKDSIVGNPGSFAEGGAFFFYAAATRALDPSQC